MMTTKELEYGISAYGTPLYIYDIDEIRDVMQKVRLQTQGLAQICYAMKANPFLTSYMMEMSDRIEVCSFGEYKICEALKIKPEKLLISGVMKDKKEGSRSNLRKPSTKAVYLFIASCTATATATVIPTIGLLPAPRNPIIST